MKKAIEVQHVSKKYTLYNDMKERLFDLITPKQYGEEFYALTDINFTAERGDIVGFIGTNGSGKSTLSNIIAGIVPETSGTVKVNGETSLIAVSAGLKGDLTGRDNIELKCLMLGFNKREIKELEPGIIEFSELGSFIDQPVKSYSSGMKSRLGFAISVNVDPEILIIDEALSVGDKAFAEKSLSKMMEFKEMGKTMIFVSHSLGQMKEFCEKILWLEFGHVKAYGPVDEVLPKYEHFLGEWKKMSNEEREAYKNYAQSQNEEGLRRLMKTSEEEEDLSGGKTDQAAYSEKSISRMGHLRGKATAIYQDPRNAKDKIAAEDYKHTSYYIKREASYYGEKFFLLSQQPSGVEGTIGWVKAEEMSTRLHILIDDDRKQFVLMGTGSAFNRPWGGSNNLIYEDLERYENSSFEAIRTEKIGENYWYYGLVDDENVWIHHNHLQ